MGGNMGETDTTQPTVMLPQNQATCVAALSRVDTLRLGDRRGAIRLCRSYGCGSDTIAGIGGGRNPGRYQYPALHHPRRIRHRRSAGAPRQVIVTPQLDNRPLGRRRR